MRLGAGVARGRVQEAVARRVSWTLRMAGKDVLVVRRGGLRAGEGVLPVPHAQLTRWLSDPRNRSALHSLYAADMGRPAMMSGSLDHGVVLDHVTAAVAEAFDRGRLIVVGAHPAWSIIANPAAKTSSAGGPVAGSNTKTKKTWIEIRLVNKKGAPGPRRQVPSQAHRRHGGGRCHGRFWFRARDWNRSRHVRGFVPGIRRQRVEKGLAAASLGS